MKPYVVRCDLLGSTGESPWSTIVHAETPERALQLGASAADTYANMLCMGRTKVVLYLMPDEYVMEEA